MAEARKRKKVPRYDEYGNYLGDFAEEPDIKAPPEVTKREPEVKAAAPVARAVPPPVLRIPAAVRRAPTGPVFRCNMDTTLLEKSNCTFTASSELELMLHRADRHLVYPPGGIDELRKKDPMRAAEERERLARLRKGGIRAADGPPDSTIMGLNIRLDTPELVSEWIKQRKKRFPTAAVVQEKEALRQRGRLTIADKEKNAREKAEMEREEAKEEAKEDGDTEEAKETEDKDDKDDEDDEDEDEDDKESSSDEGTDSSSSDMDPERDAVSSKIPVPERPTDAPRLCRFYLQGTCTFGEQCRHAHGDAPQKVRRTAPRPPPSNPFQAPELLRSLLENEIAQHVDALGQVIRFVLDNDMLFPVERVPGQAAEQAQRRQKIVPLHDAPRGRPPSPTLRALVDLVWPPEPDPLVYHDPLRRADPKPLRPSELEAIAKDDKLRTILAPCTPLHPHGHVNESLRSALQSWDALPTDRHRAAALQLILGVGTQSPMHAHDAYTPPGQRARPAAVHTRQRPITEAELLRCGLRVGPDEVRLIQHMAEVVSAATSGAEFTL